MSKAKQFTVDNLRDQIRRMDEMSQAGFSQIGSLAHIALRSLETKDGSLDVGAMADLLTCIMHKARECEFSINAEAEFVGCNYVDEALARRIDARAAAVSQAAIVKRGA